MSAERSRKRKMRMGIIGAGLATKWLHLPAIKRMQSEIEVVSIADISLEAANEIAAEVGSPRCTTDYRELLADEAVEAVLVSLPIHLNAQVLVETARAGKHVLCEKPLGATLKQAQEAVNALRDVPVVVSIAEHFHHRWDVRTARSWIEEGRIGTPFMIDVRCHYWTDTTEGFGSTLWRQDSQYRGGAVTDAGVHHAALLRELGGEVEQLQAFTKLVHPEMSGVDTLVLNARFRNGALGRFFFSAATSESYSSFVDAVIFGTEGTLWMDGKSLRLKRRGAAEEVEGDYDQDEAFYEQMRNFYRAVTQGEDVVVTPEVALKDLEVIMRALDSADNRGIELFA